MSKPIHHAIDWFEIPVTNMDRSVAFYEQLLGVRLRRETMTGTDLAVFPASDRDGVAGALMRVDQVTPGTNNTMVYLNAGPSLNAVVDKVVSLGGQLLLPRVDLPGDMGCFVHIADPDGQRIGLHALA